MDKFDIIREEGNKFLEIGLQKELAFSSIGTLLLQQSRSNTS